MPNRMFDPVSNPFAIQNLLEKKVETFVEHRDDLPDSGFAFDPVVMANPVHGFAEQTMEDPAAEAAQDFQAEWMDAGNEFAGDGTQAVADFVDDPATAASMSGEAGFHADGNQVTTHDVADVADSDPVSGAEATADVSDEHETSEVLAKAADGDESDVDSEAHASTEAGTAVLSDSGERLDVDTAHAQTSAHSATDDPTAEASHAAMADETLVEVNADASSTSDTELEPPSDSTEPVAVAASQTGISDEELHARLEAAREEARAEERVSAHQQGYDEGYGAGVAKTREDYEQQTTEKLAQLQSVIDALQALSYNPDALFEPMKKLSIHLAEQLVRGELSQSPQAISRLVDNCLRELNASGEKAVIIHLHPEDLELYKPQAAQFGDALLLRADPKLERGSVRASLEGSVVEDLMQRRIAGLKKSLSQAAAPSWRTGNAPLSDRIADGQRGSQHVEDVTATTTADSADA